MNDPVLGAVDSLRADIDPTYTSFTTKALIVAEFMNDEGGRGLHIIRDEGLQNWEIRGMLAEVLADMDAYDIVDVLDAD